MKRIVVIVGALFALGVGYTASAEATPTTSCNNTWGNTERDLVDTNGVYVGTEVSPNYGGEERVLVCYDVDGIIGGHVQQWRWLGTNESGVRCYGEPGNVVTVSCYTSVATQTTDDADPSTTGRSATATVQVQPVSAGVGQTGAQVNPAATADRPADGTNKSTGGLAGTGTGTCVWVNGSSSCPGSATVAGVTVNESDLIRPNTPSGGGCIGVNGTCVLPSTGYGVGKDSGSTVTVDSPAGQRTADIPPPGACIEVGASC